MAFPGHSHLLFDVTSLVVVLSGYRKTLLAFNFIITDIIYYSS